MCKWNVGTDKINGKKLASNCTDDNDGNDDNNNNNNNCYALISVSTIKFAISY